jgi:hypothetical protein
MPFVRSAKSAHALLGAAALALTLFPVSSRAYTPEQQQACSGDAMRLCGPEIPDVERITACMIRNKAQLSPQCAVYFRSGPEPAAGKPMRIDPPAKKSAKKPAKHNAKKPPAT